MANRVDYIEDKSSLKIIVNLRDSLYWTLPVLIFSIILLGCGLFLLFIVISASIRANTISINVVWILMILLNIIGGFMLYRFLLDTFGKETIFFDNNLKVMKYKKSVFGIGRTKIFSYEYMSDFVAAETLENYQFRRRENIWARCAFTYNKKMFKFGILPSLLDGQKIILKINNFIKM